MSNINKAAVLNPFSDLTSNILDYVPRATTSEFGIVAIGSGINVDNLGRIYLDTQEYSDRLTAIEAQAASSLATQKSEVAAAIAQVNLTQSQAITALTLEVSNLKTDLTDSITATQTDLINRADQLAQDVTVITVQLTQDKATFTQEIQDALVYLQNESSVASALRTPRKIQGIDFDGTQDISLPIFTTQTDGLVPKREGSTTTKYLREDGTWVVPPNTTYTLLTQANAEAGTATTASTISAKVLKEAIQYHAPTVTNIAGNAGTATKLQTPRTINGVLFDGTQNISLPEAVAYSLPTASASVLGGIKVGSGLAISNSVLSVGTLNQSTTGNAATATKLQTARTINGVAFDGTSNITIADNTKLPLTGGTISGQLVAPNIMINHSSKEASGISWYSSSYNSWQDYMAQAGSTGNGVHGNLTAPTGTYVTTWARRSVIEPSAGYGWTFETMTMNGTAPSIAAELSINGTFKTAGDIHGANLHASEVNTNGVRTSNFYSSTAYSFYGPDNFTSQRIKCNSILASDAWADEPYVPHLGIFARGGISSAGNITATGSVTAYSDKRIKEDVTVIENALTKVEQLNGVTFKRKDTLDRQTGLLAQEVEAVLPEAVTRQKASEEIKAITGDEEVLAVNYGALVGLLVEAIKELETKVAKLEGK